MTPSLLAIIGILALLPVLVVLYDEWRYPATSFTIGTQFYTPEDNRTWTYNP